MNERPTETLAPLESYEGMTSKIELNISRHDNKAKSVPGVDDKKVLLTPEGREHAMKKAFLANTNSSMAIASPRARAQETALLHMAGKTGEVTSDMDLETIMNVVDRHLPMGSKIMVDNRLDFNLKEGDPYEKALIGALKKGELIKWIIEESESAAAELGDKTSSTYSSLAAGVAQIVKKYFNMASNVDKIVQANKEEDAAAGDTMYRFMGTHQTVGESFLGKVIEKTLGMEERAKFIEAVSEGFRFSEGFKVDIVNVGPNESHILVSFERPASDQEAKPYKMSVEITREILDEIIGEDSRAVSV